jgi:hypothetical protein
MKMKEPESEEVFKANDSQRETLEKIRKLSLNDS